MSNDLTPRQRIVLAALASNRGASYAPVQVQKLFFLLDENIADEISGPQFRFEPYNYGPFDVAIYSELEALERKGLALIRPQAPNSCGRRYALTPTGQASGERILRELSPRLRGYMRTVSAWVCSLSFAQLVGSIYKAYPHMRARSIFVEQMTSIVGIRCSDGIVIGADSAATFGPHPQFRTIEQPYGRKIEIIGGNVIVAGTGFVGHAQRFSAVIAELSKGGAFTGRLGLDLARHISKKGIDDFSQTNVQRPEYCALVAYAARDGLFLCELQGAMGFQPEIKEASGLWFVSAGSGQVITDPFLALLRTVFWNEGPPNLYGGIFTACWALMHACESTPGASRSQSSWLP